MKKWMTKALLAVAGFGVLAFMEGCYPDNTLTVSQADNVLTGYNDSVNFQSLHTYYMPDTIIWRDSTVKDPVKDQDAYLAEIASQMQAMGYQRFTLADTTGGKVPDVDLFVTASEQSFLVGGWYDPWYGGGWWGPWYPGGGWWYPPYYYPPIPWYSEYKTGTVLMEMVNPNDYDIIKGDTVARVYWNGALNGLLEGSNIKTRVLDGIAQAFKQSPEIKTSSK